MIDASTAGRGCALDVVAEICCGAAEALQLLRDRPRLATDLAVSTAMLERARQVLPGPGRMFVQGDAMRAALAQRSFEVVFLLGGIHHINDRQRLCRELHRILKPSSRLYWREPVDDCLPWRLARRIIYRLSSTLEADTEHPLRYASTVNCRFPDSGDRMGTHSAFLGIASG